MEWKPTAIPLITVDPYFSIWSFSHCLYDDSTRHWTGRRNSMAGMIRIDGRTYRFMGRCNPFSERYAPEPECIPQVSVSVQPLSSVYVFQNEQVRLTVTFFTPLLPDDPAVMSRPASYIAYTVDILDGKPHEVTVYVDILAECCINSPDQKIRLGKGALSVYAGNSEQLPLNKKGDDVLIDWGYVHLSHPNAVLSTVKSRLAFAWGGEVTPADTEADYSITADALFQWYTGHANPVLAAVSDRLSDVFCVAYDDVLSIDYYGVKTPGYYLTAYKTFDAMLAAAVNDYPAVRERAARFEAELLAEASAVSEKYAWICALVYRQTIAAHKLIADENGDMVFLSKECYSNGCIGTMDITYPSVFLFLRYAPELVKGMLRPILRQALQPEWTAEYTPHDCGTYPICCGNVYGSGGMPVEECGNMLITVAAVCRAEHSTAFAEAYHDLLKKWADYLLKNGYDPDEQLCTDDFAGHLSHNCNLSVKAIVALAAYGRLFSEERYTAAAADMAKRWVREASNAQGTRLTFDREDTWSLKYNMVWDKILGLGLFDESVYRREIAMYKRHRERYGVPLDNRATYTKFDWLVWTTAMTNDRDYADSIFDCLCRMISETPDRVPLTDWFDAKTARMQSFQNRSVMGAVYIHLCRDIF